MTELGEIYDEAYFGSYHTAVGALAYERNEHWLGFFDQVAEQITRRLRPGTSLDAGCAMGFLVEALHKRGVDARGFDVSPFAISQADASIADAVWVQSLTDPIDGRYDLVTCIEVIEHLPAADAPVALARLTSITDQLLLSTTPVDWEEPTHENVRPPEYWAELLAGFEFFHDLEFDATFLSPWAALYRRRPQPVGEVVRSYERETWRLRQEVVSVRQALLERSAESGGTTVEALRHDLRRAIDAARAAEAEKAVAVGRLRHVEYALDVAKEREREFVDLVAAIDENAARMDRLRNSRLLRLGWRATYPFRYARRRLLGP